MILMAVFDILVTFLAISLIVMLARKAWVKADVVDKIDEMETTEELYEDVTVANLKHENIKEKMNVVNRFKNEQ